MKIKHKTSYISSIRNEYASNRDFVLRESGMSNDFYNNLMIDSGIEFLRSHYPVDKPELNEFFTIINKDPLFWKWWNSEWKRFESKMIKIYQYQNTELTESEYIVHMLLSTTDTFVRRGFYENYLAKKSISLIKKVK